MNAKRRFYSLVVLTIMLIAVGAPTAAARASSPVLQAGDPAEPLETVKLIFIHHSTGGNWLADETGDYPSGGLGQALLENNYFVSAANYGWGPDSIGDRTDIPNWPEWFTGANSSAYLEALYHETGQNIEGFGAWSRLADPDPNRENEIILFKSCFPNSDLYGNPSDPPLDEPNDQYTVANAKAVYNELLTYFETRPDKLFIVITAPPLMADETAANLAANARAFNNWLVHEWLVGYPYANVAVFDYYNVLTAPDNHHRWNGSEIEHLQAGATNFSAYPSGDSHPTSAGHRKATAEFVPLLNVYYHRWQAGELTAPPATVAPAAPTATPAEEGDPTSETPIAPPPDQPPSALIDNFEGEIDYYTDAAGAQLTVVEDTAVVHGGASALRVDYAVEAGGYASVGRSYDSPQDWSDFQGLEIWLRADPPGQQLTLGAYAGEPESPAPYEIVFEAAEAGWQRYTFGWDEFARASWAAEDDPLALDPARILGYGFNVTEPTGGAVTLWVDDIALHRGAVETPESSPAAPPATAVPAEPASGVCPLAASLALFSILIVSTRKGNAQKGD